MGKQEPVKGQEHEICTYCGGYGHISSSCQKAYEDVKRGCRNEARKQAESKSASALGSTPHPMRRAAIIIGVDCSGDDDYLTLELPKGLLSGVKTGDPVEILYFVYKA